MNLSVAKYLALFLILMVGAACKSNQPRRINSTAEISLKGAFAIRDVRKIRDAIKAGARVNIRNRDGSTLVDFAVVAGDKDLVELIIDNGGDLAAITRGFTPLISAAWRGNTDILRLLSKAGADLNARDDYGRTALMLAVAQNKLKAVKFLLEKGADKNMRESDGYTALDIGIKERRYWIVQLLRKAGAKNQENAGTTAYRPISPEFACEDWKYYRLVVSFISYGAGPNLSAGEMLRTFIRRWPKPVSFGAGGYGPEGEHSYCFNLEGYSKDEREEFQAALQKDLAPFSSVTAKQNSAVPKYPDHIPGPAETNGLELKHKNLDRPRKYLPLRKGPGKATKKSKHHKTQ